MPTNNSEISENNMKPNNTDNMIKFEAHGKKSSIIKVIGVGGGGNNAVNHMYNQGIVDVDFIQCNTDKQILDSSPIPVKIQLGTSGLGAGNKPEVGRKAAEESIEQIREVLEKDTKMLFITAGMGGGTGTGAAPVIASVARELDILTVGIVTIPFSFEGRKRKQQAEIGIAELRKYVDTLLVINNDKLREFWGNLSLRQAFAKADDVLTRAAKGIAEIITVKAYVNVDFEDVKTVMKDSGKALMGSSRASGDGRALKAAMEALNSPLLDDNTISGARNMLLYISSGKQNEITMDEVTEITTYIQDNAGNDVDIIWGVGYDDELGEDIAITLIATSFEPKKTVEPQTPKVVHTLDDETPESLNPLSEDAKTVEPILIKTTRPVSESESQAPAEPRSPGRVFTLFDEPENNGSELKPDVSTFPAEAGPMLKTSSEPSSSQPMYGKATPAVDPIKSNERVARLKGMSSIFSDPLDEETLQTLESIPAYKRRGAQLTPPPPATESLVPRNIITNGPGGPEIRSNPYLFDNPD